MEQKPTCHDCIYYYGQRLTSTNIETGYCDMKDSKRFGLPYGSLQFVVYGDNRKCKYYEKIRNIEGQLSIFDLFTEGGLT